MRILRALLLGTVYWHLVAPAAAGDALEDQPPTGGFHYMRSAHCKPTFDNRNRKEPFTTDFNLE